MSYTNGETRHRLSHIDTTQVRCNCPYQWSYLSPAVMTHHLEMIDRDYDDLVAERDRLLEVTKAGWDDLEKPYDDVNKAFIALGKALDTYIKWERDHRV